MHGPRPLFFFQCGPETPKRLGTPGLGGRMKRHQFPRREREEVKFFSGLSCHKSSRCLITHHLQTFILAQLGLSNTQTCLGTVDMKLHETWIKTGKVCGGEIKTWWNIIKCYPLNIRGSMMFRGRAGHITSWEATTKNSAFPVERDVLLSFLPSSSTLVGSDPNCARGPWFLNLAYVGLVSSACWLICDWPISCSALWSHLFTGDWLCSC